jgi:CubicO group peptidase (beta-lactamase class C family)
MNARQRKTVRLGTTVSIIAFVMVGCAVGGGEVSPSAADAAGSESAARAAPLEEYVSQLESELSQLMERYDIPGAAIAIVREGRLVWSGAYGYADRDAARPMTVDTVVRAESISKSVTAWGVMHLVQAGELALETPVTDLVSNDLFLESEHDPSSITVRMLLSNSSGLPLGTIGPVTEYSPGSPTPSATEFVSGDARLVRAPGSSFIYSDVGFNLLEIIVQRVSEREFPDYMRDSVLAPLGMSNSEFGWRSTYTGRIATGYELGGDPVGAYVYPASASGGLFSTVEDLARFVTAGVAPHDSAGAILSPAAVEKMHAPETEIPGLFGFVADAYGYGHFVETLPDGRRAVWHGGQGHGWMTHFHAVPESGDGIVIVTNSQRSWPLMARILEGWSRWAGLGSVKFARVVLAGTVARFLVATLFAITVIQIIRLVGGIRFGRRRWRASSRRSVLLRTLQAVAGTALAILLIWRVTEPYVFESSIFPTVVGWAAITVAVMSVTLLVSAAFPVVHIDESPRQRESL